MNKAPLPIEREETKNKRGRSDSKSHSAHAMIEVFRYVSHYEELPSAGRAEAMVCCARRAEAGICAGGVPCSLI